MRIIPHEHAIWYSDSLHKKLVLQEHKQTTFYLSNEHSEMHVVSNLGFAPSVAALLAICASLMWYVTDTRLRSNGNNYISACKLYWVVCAEARAAKTY